MNTFGLFLVLIGTFATMVSVDKVSTAPIPPPISDFEGFSIRDLTDLGFQPSIGGIATALQSDDSNAVSKSLGIVYQRKIKDLVPNVEQLIARILCGDNRQCIAEYAVDVCFQIDGKESCGKFTDMLEYERSRPIGTFEPSMEFCIAYMYKDFALMCNQDVSSDVLARAFSSSKNLAAARCYIVDILFGIYKEKLTDETIEKLYAHWGWDEDLAEAIRLASGKTSSFFKDIKLSRFPKN